MKSWFSLSLLLVAGIFVSGLYLVAHRCVFVAEAATTTGKVVGFSHDTESYHHPVFTFTDATGREHRCVSENRSDYYWFTAGEPVTVLYDAASPECAEIDTFRSLWLIPLTVLGCGVMGILSFYRERQRE